MATDDRAGADRCGACALRGADAGRRRFVQQLALSAAALLVGASCGDGEIGGPAGPTVAPPIDGGPFTIAIADFPPLANVGGIARVDGGSSTPIAVARLDLTTFVAMSMICPHAGYRPISIVSGGFICPNHGAEFETDGQWSGGQQTRDLVLYAVDHDAGAGTLTIS